MESVYNYLKNVETYFLATIDGNKPKVRPFGTIDLYNGKLYIQTGLKKDVAKQLLANPNAEICAFNSKDGTWLRVSGKLILDDDRQARKHMLDAYPNLRSMYNEDDGNTAVFYFTEATAIFSSFTASPTIIHF